MADTENFPASATVIDDSIRYLVYDLAFPLVLDTALFNTHLILAVYFVYLLWKDRKTTPTLRFKLFLTLAMLVLASIYWSLSVFDVHDTTRTILKSPDSYIPGENPSAFLSIGGPLGLVQQISALLILAIGDGVTLWRAYVVCGRRRWLRILNIILVVFVLCFQAVFIGITQAFAYLSVAYLSLLITWFPHVFSTLLIARKAWLHWRDVREFAYKSGMRHSLAILTIVIESGIIYVVIYFLYTATSVAGGISGKYSMPYDFFIPLAAMYPTIVFLLLAERKSLLERTIDAVSTRDVMHFAEPAGTRRSHADHTGIPLDAIEYTPVLQSIHGQVGTAEEPSDARFESGFNVDLQNSEAPVMDKAAAV
ncbi:unnamed protein product [Peniophora sp. CBMAI 1063]|nr:unnamed protein product [Peniophora sp. CBMAI 1063]